MPRLDDVLPEADIHRALDRLSHWQLHGGRLVCDFHFPGFPSAIRFVNSIAAVAEEAQHHPQIEIRYDHVRLSLRSHDAGGVTQRDLRFARAVNALCGRPGAR